MDCLEEARGNFAFTKQAGGDNTPPQRKVFPKSKVEKKPFSARNDAIDSARSLPIHTAIIFICLQFLNRSDVEHSSRRQTLMSSIELALTQIEEH